MVSFPAEARNASPDAGGAAPDLMRTSGASMDVPDDAAQLCATHPDHVSVGTCSRCGNFFCAACRAPSGCCAACHEGLGRRRVPWWAAASALLFGGLAAQIAGAIPVAVGIVVFLVDHADEGPPADMAPVILALTRTFWVLGPSIALVGGTMALFAFVVPLLAKVPLKRALGLNGAPWVAFLVAPVGMLALGPTSDFLRRMMQELFPWATFGALEGLDQIARAAPIFIVLPAMALVPGFAEELLFRGLFQRSIRTAWLAVILSGILFACYHMDPQHVVAVLPLGLYLAWLAQRTDSVFVPISAHVFNNTAAVLGSVYFPEAAGDESIDWWWMPIGWAVCASMVFVVWWSTRKKG